MTTKAEVKQTRKEVAMKTGITELREEVKKEITETEGKIKAKIREIIKEEVTTMKQGMQKETKNTKGVRSKDSEQMRGKRGKTRSRAAGARMATGAGNAMQAGDMEAMIVKQWRWGATTMKKPDEETRSRTLAKINTSHQTIRDRGMGADYCQKAIVRNEIRA